MLIGRPDANHAGDAAGRAHGRLGIVAPEAGVRESRPHRAVHRDDQPGRVEIRLGINVPFQRRTMSQLHATAAKKCFVPNLKQTWRVIVPIISVLHHEASPV